MDGKTVLNVAVGAAAGVLAGALAQRWLQGAPAILTRIDANPSIGPHHSAVRTGTSAYHENNGDLLLIKLPSQPPAPAIGLHSIDPHQALPKPLLL